MQKKCNVLPYLQKDAAFVQLPYLLERTPRRLLIFRLVGAALIWGQRLFGGGAKNVLFTNDSST